LPLLICNLLLLILLLHLHHVLLCSIFTVYFLQISVTLCFTLNTSSVRTVIWPHRVLVFMKNCFWLL
jgi:hypothetical protein